MRGRRGLVAAALVVLVLLGSAWFELFGPRGQVGGPMALTDVGPISVWPESPLSPAGVVREVQDRVDRGEDRWRSSPTAVVSRFAKSVFGWNRVEFGDAAATGVGASAAATVDVSAAPADRPRSYAIRAGCGDKECGPVDDRWVRVAVGRLGAQRAGGAWSVVAVTSDRLRLPVGVGQTVAAGAELAIQLDLAEDEHAAVGLRYVQRIGGATTDCGDVFEGQVDVTGATVELMVPEPIYRDAVCTDLPAAGYLFAYTTPTLTVQTGDPLLESAAITDLSIVPVLFGREALSSPTPTVP